MNIQFGEKLLNISPTLAAQIGLEEAVLAQLVFELSHVCPVKEINSLEWFYLAPERWPELVPFWNMTKIHHIFQNLEQLKIVQRHFNDNGQFLIRLVPDNAFHPSASSNQSKINKSSNIHLTSQPNIDNADIPVAMPIETPSVIQRPIKPNRQMNPARQRNQLHGDLPTYMIERSQQLNQSQHRPKRTMTPNWQPDISLLTPRISSANIPNKFVYEQLPGFITFHMERATIASDWNSRFIKWVLQEWTNLSKPGHSFQSHSNQKQEQRDAVRRKIMDIHDTNW